MDVAVETSKEATIATSAPLQRVKTLQISQIEVINDIDGCRAWIPTLKSHCDEVNILGFDCEWVSNGPRRPVALLQLATHRGLCLLIRLCLFKTIPNELKEILEDENIIKVGVIPLSDAKNLEQDYSVQTRNTFDVRYLVQSAGCEARGLKIMADSYLNLKWKEDFRFHALWEKPTLRDDQIKYAAMDVFVAVELFKLFSEKLQSKSESEDQKTYTQSIISKYCEKYFDKDFEKECTELKGIIPSDPSVEIDVKIIGNADECQSWIQTFKSHCEEFNVLGFQCIYSKEQAVSTLQLSTYQGLCLVIELCKLGTVPAEVKEILEDENIIKIGYKPWDQVKYFLRDHNIFVTSALDLRLLFVKSIEFDISLCKLCEVFLNVKFKANTNAAYVNMELFKLFAEKLQSKKPDEDEKTHVQQIIQKYTSHHRDLKYIGGVHSKKSFTVIVNSLDRCSLLMPMLKLHCREYNVLGIDWTFERKGRARGQTQQVMNNSESVALLHLTTHRGVCVIINLCNLRQIPAEIKEILQDDRIIKVGTNPSDISNYLLRDHNIRVRSSLDVRYMAQMAGSVEGNLDQIFSLHLGKYRAEAKFPLSWANEKFKDKELEFSAKNSHQAVELFKFFHLKLVENGSFEGRSTSAISIVEKYLDKNYGFAHSGARASNFAQGNDRERDNRNRNNRWNSTWNSKGGNRNRNRNRNRHVNKRYRPSNRYD